MPLASPILLDSPLHIPTQLGGYDPASAPALAALGMPRLDRAYEYDLTTDAKTITANLSTYLAKVSGNLSVNGEFFSADDPASLDIRRVDKFEQDLDLFRSLTPPGTKIWWFGGPVIGSSLTDPAELVKSHLADGAFVAHGMLKRIDGIAWGVYYSTGKTRMRDFFVQVRAGCSLAQDFNLPIMLYASPLDFATPHDRLKLATWGAYLQEASRVLDDGLAQQVALYTTPQDGTALKFDPNVDQPYFDAAKALLS